MAIRRTPFDDMYRMMEQMDAMMEEFRRSAFTPRWGVETPAIEARSEFHMGSNLSMEETDEGYVVLADIPGFEKEEISLTFDEGVLTLRAEHEEEDEHTTRSRSVFEQLSVPGDVLVEEISATYRNGVLEVTVPVASPEAGDADAHRIDID